ncbi:MAG: MBL fold metallo-hydrolase, partial [Zoogloea sp.]|nr:MBL fold metallo-hydrolase [Zoogloea sp.]
HACLYCPGLKLLVAGDQVLPRISSNVSVFATEPQANPLKEWFESLDKLAREVPADVLVLPSHNEPFYGLHERLGSLRAGQERALERLRQSLTGGPQRIVDVFPALFHRAIDEQDGQQLSLATGEAVACMNYFIAESAVGCTVDGSGVAWYELKS